MSGEKSAQSLKERVRQQAERYIGSCCEYTSRFERDKLINNWITKDEKSDALVQDFRRRAGEVAGKQVLEIGFGNAAYAAAFARAGGIVHGLEVNEVLLSIGREHIRSQSLSADLRLYDGVHFPYENDTFDHIYMISVLEHVSRPKEVLSEASRVLKPGGTFYISFPNRWAPRETHSGVWLISYLPLRVAEIVFRRLLRRNTVRELNLHFISYWSFRRMLRGTFLCMQYEIGTGSPPRRILKRVLAMLGMHHSAILRTVMVVLKKQPAMHPHV